MAKNQIKKYQSGGGVFMGGISMGGEKEWRVAELARAIEEQKKRAAKGGSFIKIIDTITDVFKTVFPGIGHAVDFGVDFFTRKATDTGDASQIRRKEHFFTEGKAGEYATAFEDMQEGMQPSLLSSIIGSGTEYLGTKAGQKTLGKLREKFKNKFKLEKDLPEMKELTGKGPVSVKDFDPTPYARDNVSRGRLSRPTEAGVNVQETPFSDPVSEEIDFKQQGGRVPMYKKGGKTPTVSDFFEMQGKSLGGSNKKSLAEMLGRR